MERRKGQSTHPMTRSFYYALIRNLISVIIVIALCVYYYYYYKRVVFVWFFVPIALIPLVIFVMDYRLSQKNNEKEALSKDHGLDRSFDQE